MKSKLKLQTFLFILDTGGWLFLRPFVLFTIIAEALLNNNKFKISKSALLNHLFLILLIIPSILSGYFFHDITLIIGFAYFAPIVLLFPLYTLLYNSKLEYKNFEYGGVYFAAFIVLLFFGFIVGLPGIPNLYGYLSKDDSAGFFGLMRSFQGYSIPAIYFKATLLLVPIGVGLFHAKKWKSLSIIFMALIISYSKFGVVILTFFILRNLISTKKFKFSLLGIIFLLLTIIFVATISSASSLILGLSTRFLHVTSIYSSLIQNPIEILIGQGAGSRFYTSAIVGNSVGGWVTDSEISQIEALRRYGFMFNFFMTLYFYKIYRKLKKISNQEKLSEGLLAYYLVSFSNPVLLTLPAMLYYAILIKETTKSENIDNPRLRILC